MYCRKCGTKVEEHFNFCPNCQNKLIENIDNNVTDELIIAEQKIERTTLDKTTLIISVVSLLVAVLPLFSYLILFGVILGLINLIIETINIVKSNTRKSMLVIIISITAVITNLGWYYFLEYAL